ncbi:MAG: hypothetical protein Q7U52_00470 [Hydrogenophaga sp.]|nr:hypothetical protein [Hydrogenophaga sp.]
MAIAEDEAPRRVAPGHTTGSSLPAKIRKKAVSRAVASRKAAPLAAVQDMLSRTDIGRPEQAESLRANLEGAGPDDAKAICRLPKQETHKVRSETKAVANPDVGAGRRRAHRCLSRSKPPVAPGV